MSKRKAGAYNATAMITATKIWPLFSWVECGGCSSEFRRQAGWLVKTDDHHLSGPIARCGECCPTAASAIDCMRVTVAAADFARRFELTKGGLKRVA
ncbi:hypothetical protein M1M11_30335 [Pseudomonas azerbaijanoccidens]|uniref:hypothetical protein n=1 Tax=Pseudomonas azerbaijanoccidentalis TaxID=2842347 RepID=UPI00200B5D8E|nr:hypothetical protein [Pseudomonas azerbaijanoccidentalis]MCK8669181.1 hypothetical protein [Pseudomonas azerbaijanoccidentalis]